MIRQGFTLVEALLVLAVISVLVAVLVVALDVRLSYERGANCTNNVKNIGVGLTLYEIDHGFMPSLSADAETGALGMGFLREGGYVESDQRFSCPSDKTDPQWDGSREYRKARARGFKGWWDQWHAKTLGYDYDNTVPKSRDPMRAILADKDLTHHEYGAMVLFADKHAEYLKTSNTRNNVPNEYVNDTDIYQGTLGDPEDCVLNGPDTDDSLKGSVTGRP